MRPKGIQDEFCEAPTHLISDANMRLMEPAAFKLVKTTLSKEKMKKVDSALAQLSLTVNTVRSIQLAIERGQLILPAFSHRLNRIKWWLDGDIQQLSHYKAKCREEGTTLLCDVASQTVQLASNEIIRIMQECGSFISPQAVNDIVNVGRDAASA